MLLAPLNDVCVYVVSLVLSVVLPSARPLALTSGRRLDVSLLSISLSLKVPQPPLVAPRRLLTSAAVPRPAALGALSGLAELPRRRRFGGRRGQRAPFLDSDGVSGNQWAPLRSSVVSADAASDALVLKSSGVADKAPNGRGDLRRTRRAVASPWRPTAVLKPRASSGGQISCVRGLAWQPSILRWALAKGSRGWCPGTRRHAIDALQLVAARDTPPTHGSRR